MDKQHRVLIPLQLRELTNFDLSKPHVLCVEDDKLFYLVETSEYTNQLAIDVVNFDEKGRFFITSRVRKYYKISSDAKEWVFSMNKRIYISFIS